MKTSLIQKRKLANLALSTCDRPGSQLDIDFYLPRKRLRINFLEAFKGISVDISGVSTISTYRRVYRRYASPRTSPLFWAFKLVSCLPGQPPALHFVRVAGDRRRRECNTFMLRSVFLFALFASAVLCASEYRAKKASRASLNRLKRLINEKTEEQHKEDRLLIGVLDDSPVTVRDPSAKRHHDELSVNNLDDYFQGDVELSEAQVDILEKEIVKSTEGEEGRKRRKVGKAPLYNRWDRTRPISFDFASSIPYATKLKIRKAMELWQKKTCVRFQENGPNVDRLEFFDGGGCSSFVGRTGGTQGISISTPGCDVVGIISHEIGHALGIFHEQARPDQSTHISVNYRNIPISRWNNFYPVSLSQADLYGLPYDAGSVMHYGPYGFATDPYTPTITTMDKNLQNTIGQRAGPSFLDFAAINIAYGCTEHCGYLPCRHQGYPNPNNCSECLCPDGFSGSLCQYVQYTSCGAHIAVSRDAVSISSPNYPYQFSSNSECVWLLEAPAGGHVFLEFEDTFQFSCEDTCDKSYVELKTGPDYRITGYRYCCSTRPTQRFQSGGNEMLVLFRGFGDRSRGFKAKVWSDLSPIWTTPSTTTTTTTTTAPTTSTTSTTTTTTTEATTTTTVEEYTRRPQTTDATTTEPYTPRIVTFPRIIYTEAPVEETTTEVPISTTTIKIPETTQPVIVTIAPVIPPVTEPPPITEPIDDCRCQEWSEWQGSCSQECGGCGKRRRSRQCRKDDCQKEEKRACNFMACPPGTNFLINNGEFHILWKGCCVGLFRSGRSCSAWEDDGQNPFLKIITSLLSPADARRNSTAIRP
uniref:Metalloendopeptidase n=1 Tax=Steinernema glaseri TaxID=37863 RepID=A0A1I8AMW9_9BILA